MPDDAVIIETLHRQIAHLRIENAELSESVEQLEAQVATLKDRLSRAENGMGEAVVQWNRLEAENQKLRAMLLKVGRQLAHLRTKNAELSESVAREGR